MEISCNILFSRQNSNQPPTWASHVIARVTVTMQEPRHLPMLWVEIVADLLCSFVETSASSVVEHRRARTLTPAVGRIPGRRNHHL
jgi:hypothetical protein